MTDASPLNYLTWKEFKIGDIFQTKTTGKNIQVPTGAMMKRQDLIEGDIPRVTVSKFDNGITGYYAFSPDKNYRVYENFISVSFLGTIFYHAGKASIDMKVHCLKPCDIELNNFIASFLVSVIRKAIANFAYSDQLSSTVLPNIIIKLPAAPDGKPDFKFMELYMLNIFSKSKAGLESLQLADTAKIPVDIRSWKEFKIGELFNVVKGTRLTKADQKSGDINFVSASAFNNGITATISNDSHIHPGNNLTVNYDGSIGYTFYQEQPFWALDDVNVLYPKFEMTKNIALFIAPIIKSVGSKHAYENKWTLEVMKADKISLPVTADGKPDFKFMEHYMQEILDDADAKINALLDY